MRREEEKKNIRNRKKKVRVKKKIVEGVVNEFIKEGVELIMGKIDVRIVDDGM